MSFLLSNLSIPFPLQLSSDNTFSKNSFLLSQLSVAFNTDSLEYRFLRMLTGDLEKRACDQNGLATLGCFHVYLFVEPVICKHALGIFISAGGGASSHTYLSKILLYQRAALQTNVSENPLYEILA